MSLAQPGTSHGCGEVSTHRADSGDGATGASAPAQAGAAPPTRSVHTANFPALLDQLGISLLVTTGRTEFLVSSVRRNN
jgi:hypothetical protein